MSSFASPLYEGIVTCENDVENILRLPTSFLEEKNWDLAQATIQKLHEVRNTVLNGGAGLAAPQIGISLPIFIYTPDRSTESLINVINPTFESIGTDRVEGYEACFSTPLQCVKLRRWKRIKCRYQDLEKQWHESILEGFPAKVFQHEMDHLQGILTLDHATAEVINFSEVQEFQDYLEKVHREDSKTYTEAGL